MTLSLEIQEKTSPMMLQWHTCKKKSEGAVLLFRLGDFYEAFYADATILAKELNLTLTQRQDIPMAGIPFHTSEQYVDKLVAKGYRVAIAEQMEDPKEVKGIVKREIVRVITPGTLVQSSLLAEKNSNFIGCLSIINHTFGFSLLDLTTAECRLFEFEDFASFCNELVRLNPKELLLSEKSFALYGSTLDDIKADLGFSLFFQEERRFEHRFAYDFLIRHFAVQSLESFGIEGMTAAINAAGCLLSYVKDDLNLPIGHIQTLKKESAKEYMALDGTTLRHLEILETAQDKTAQSTLLYHIDHTLTPMGGRLLKHWISHPLLSPLSIQKRQDAVEFFLQSPSFLKLNAFLNHIRDLERLIMKVEMGFGGPKDLASLKLSLQNATESLLLLQNSQISLIQEQVDKLCDVSNLIKRLQETLQDDPPLRLSDGNVIRTGFSKALDELRILCTDSQTWIATYQTTLREQTGIKTLKVGYTKAFGYYIEVTRAQSDKIPPSFQRRQTLVNNERFITNELKEYEYKVLSAEEKIAGMENQFFSELKEEITTFASRIRQIASAIAHVDCLRSLAKVAIDHSYTRPVVNEGSCLLIEDGRHPVIEAFLKTGSFIPNDTVLDAEENRLLLITGPNIAGKSTFIRQVALITILAQIGSFVPAKHAQIGIVDKVFTRIGASDNLSKGQSTFMVEMTETASILHGATDRSLVILDEIGRGTSTFDGISIAWAVAEYLLITRGKQAKTLFATHYCELIELEEKIPGAVNYHIAVHESEKGIVFLRKILRGGTDKSYGIHVAKLAGIPLPVLKKADEMLKNLEKTALQKPKKIKQEQLTFDLPPQEHPFLHEIRNLDLDNLTPMEALQRLSLWKRKL